MSDAAEFSLFDWERIVLAARFSSTTKLVAFAMRTHADPDGTRVRPGTARLCVECDVSYASVKRARQDLIRAGLLELVRRGNRRKGRADEYRLILADDVLDRLKWLSPSEITSAAEKITEQRQAAETARLRNRLQGSQTDPETDQGSQVAQNRGSGLTDDRDQGSPRAPTKPGDHSTRETNSVVGRSTHHAREDEVDETISITVEGEAREAPACSACGMLLDPDGTCPVGHRQAVNHAS